MLFNYICKIVSDQIWHNNLNSYAIFILYYKASAIKKIVVKRSRTIIYLVAIKRWKRQWWS